VLAKVTIPSFRIPPPSLLVLLPVTTESVSVRWQPYSTQIPPPTAEVLPPLTVTPVTSTVPFPQ
jgi:hypothetical protein